jgi:hypothetical protein
MCTWLPPCFNNAQADEKKMVGRSNPTIFFSIYSPPPATGEGPGVGAQAYTGPPRARISCTVRGKALRDAVLLLQRRDRVLQI